MSEEKKVLNQKRSTRSTTDPFQQRLNHIRIHILNNKKQTKRTHAEPTLVLEQFLYLGGLKSLQDQVNSRLIPTLFLYLFLLRLV